MDILIKLIFSAAGFSWILTMSKLFKSTREWITRKHKMYTPPVEVLFAQAETEKGVIPLTFMQKKYKRFWWFWNELMNCSGCMGFWGGVIFCPDRSQWWNHLTYGCIGAISALILLRYSENIKK